MKAIEILKIGSGMLKIMSKFDLRTDDYRYIGLFDEYWQQRLLGIKVDAILCNLAQRYNLSESTVKRLIKRFGREVKL